MDAFDPLIRGAPPTAAQSLPLPTPLSLAAMALPAPDTSSHEQPSTLAQQATSGVVSLSARQPAGVTAATIASALANSAGSTAMPDARGVLIQLFGLARADNGGGDVGLAQHPGERELRQRAAGLPATGLSFCTASRTGGCSQSLNEMPHAVAARRAYRPGAAHQEDICRTARLAPAATRRSGKRRFSRQSGMTFSSGLRHSSEYCGWLETKRSTPGIAKAASICAGRPFAEADIARLALAHDVAQRLHRLLQRRLGVVAVALIEIDMIDTQALQRRVDLLEDLRARQALDRVSLIGKKTFVAST